MQFTVSAKKTRQEGDYKITRIDTIARWFLWSKVEMDGKALTKHNDYVAALSKLKPAEMEEACKFATGLAKAAHDKREAKAGMGGANRSGNYR